jgi:hypothetical protein
MKSYLVLGFAALAACSFADQYSWVQWSGVDGSGVLQGTIATDAGTVNVSLSGGFDGLMPSYPSWTPTSTWADGTIINNAPDSNAIVHMSNPSSYTLSFSQAVENLALAAWSVGQNGDTVAFTFDHNFSLIAGGPSAEYMGQSIVQTASKQFTGEEGNGTVLFGDTLNTLNFATTNYENWYGISVGLDNHQAVPEPASMCVLGLGVVGLIKRRKAAK